MGAWLSKSVRGILPRSLNRARNSVIGALCVLSIGASAATAAVCDPEKVELRWEGGKARFSVEIADTYEERGKGLMFREEMAKFSGMLFIYPEPSSVAFWMKNTLIPLDMIFLDATGVVKRIHENATPQSLETIPGGENILAVLEINGGLSRRLGIEVGAQMHNPAFDPAIAQWPC